jgi:hypothetical protein
MLTKDAPKVERGGDVKINLVGFSQSLRQKWRDKQMRRENNDT